MGKKIKVNSDLGKCLDSLFKEWDKKAALEYHIFCNTNWAGENRKPLKQLSIYEFSEIIFNGYEIEETPEEKLSKIYNKENKCPSDFHFNVGIDCALRILNIKIKGINE